MPKLERLYRTRDSVKLAGLVLLADGLLSISAEYGCEASGEILGSEARVYYRGCTPMRPLFELEGLEELGLRLRLTEGLGGKSVSELFREAASIALGVISELKPFSLLTSASEVEYALLVLRSGDVYVAEGEPGRVVLPYIEDLLVEAHTHPGSCLPSRRDLREVTRRFMEGLYASGITGADCTFLLYRVGPLSEEDLETLTKLPSLIGSSVLAGRRRLRNLEVLLVPE